MPAFEGLDELYFYSRSLMFSAEPASSEPIFFRLASLVLRLESRPPGPVEPRYNPGFDFVSNQQRGAVTRFEHERQVAPRGHVRSLYALRGLVGVLAVLTALCIYGTVLLTLGRCDAAVAVAMICIAVPQFSFMNAVVHGEAVTRLFGAAAALVVAAGLVKAIRRPVMWLALALLLLATPFVDRQGFFVIALAGAGVVMVEPTWRRRAVVLLLLAAPAAALAVFVARYNESGNLGPWFQLVRHPIRPLFYADPAFGSAEPPDASYYLFEFLPKLFISFWAWLGQPSILLPPPIYAALAVLTIVGVAGASAVLGTGRAPLALSREQLTALRVLALGIVAMCVPIAYGPAIAGRNLWFGRWLFPMIGPIVMLLGIGWAAAIETASRRRLAAVLLAIGAAVAAVLWVSAPGDEFRSAITTYHYGDRPHLVLVARDTIAAFAIAAVCLALTARWQPAAAAVQDIRLPAAAAVALNLYVLAAIIRPLYAPLMPEDFVAMIRRDVAVGRMSRAADVYASAVKIYPDSRVLRGLADEAPRLLVSERLDEMSGLLQDQLARGAVFDQRDTLLLLARFLRANRSASPEAIERAIAHAEGNPELAEPAALVRLALAAGWSDPAAASRPIAAGHGRSIRTKLRGGDAFLEGATVHVLGGGSLQVVVYYRPRADWTNRRIWLHAFPDTAPQRYLDPPPTITSSETPTIGALEWAAFELPPGRYLGYVGVWAGTSMGDASPIGPLP